MFQFGASAPVVGAVGATAGAEIGGQWKHEGVSGVFRCGSKPGQTYTTLFFDKAIGRRNDAKRELERPDPSTLEKDTCVAWLRFFGDGH